jgi:hypothetical protein
MKTILKYLLVIAAVGAILYFGITKGDPGALRMETSGL